MKFRLRVTVDPRSPIDQSNAGLFVKGCGRIVPTEVVFLLLSMIANVESAV